VNLRPHRPDPPDINLTPLIDVVFLLLIFFMLSTTFKDDARIEIRLPEIGEVTEQPEAPTSLEIVVDASGGFYVNDRQVVNAEVATLTKAIAAAVGDRRDLPVIIKADARSPHQAVMTVMDAASRLGLQRFSFAASRSDGP
jgi:biopolymer transport protein ExbD